jgi:hypothetical protein
LIIRGSWDLSMGIQDDFVFGSLATVKVEFVWLPFIEVY